MKGEGEPLIYVYQYQKHKRGQNKIKPQYG